VGRPHDAAPAVDMATLKRDHFLGNRSPVAAPNAGGGW
jgi:hypothetical protein